MKEESTIDEKSQVEIDLDKKQKGADQTVGFDCPRALDLLPGQTVAGRYIVMEELGRGGMGVVYKVNQFALSRHLVLKTIHSKDIPDSIWRRFQQEAKATGLLHHPNLISVHEFGLLEDNHPYFVMDLIEGTTLAKLIEKGGPLSVVEAIPLMLQVCFGLAYAHDVGIIHRDIKPSNIMLCKTETGTASSTVKIVDFGIAKLHSEESTQGLTRTGEIFGSPLYMSPEQCLGQPVDHRSDIYAFGCVFFETLTGLPPFQGTNALATMMKHQTEKPPTLKEITLGKEFPQEIEKMVARLLSKDPDQRYQSLKSVARDLSLLQQGVSAQEFSGAVDPAEKIQIVRNIPLTYALLMQIAGMLLVGAISWTMRGNFDAEMSKSKTEAKELQPPVHLPNLTDTKTDPPFTSIVTINGVRCRRFDLTPGFGSYRVLGGSPAVEIKGPFYIPLTQEIVLKVKDLITVTSPQFFSRFKSDDIAMLDIANNINVSDTTFEQFSNLKTLRYLFAGNIDVTNKVIDEFNRMPNLKAVYVDGTMIRQNGLVNYKYLRECSELGIGRNGPMDRVLQKLKGSKNLTVLSLENSDLTDDQLKLIATLPNVWELNIEHNRKLTNAGFKNLLTMKHLRLLRIAGTKINPEIIPDLKKLPSLKTMYVYPDLWKDKDKGRLKSEAGINMDIDFNDWELYSGRKNHVEVDINDVKKIYQRNPVKSN